jgi:hypothetical protein
MVVVVDVVAAWANVAVRGRRVKATAKKADGVFMIPPGDVGGFPLSAVFQAISPM